MNRNFTAAILVVLAIGIYFTVTRGVLDDINSVQAVNNQYSSAIANADQLIRARDGVLKDYNSISSDDQARLDKMIPNTVDNIRLIIDLNSVAARHGLTLKSVKAVTSQNNSKQGSPAAAANLPANPSTVNPVAPGIPGATVSSIVNPIMDSVTVSFGTGASYQQFMDFLRDIEANLRIMDVTKLSLTANDSGLYDFTVEMKTYWLRQ